MNKVTIIISFLLIGLSHTQTITISDHQSELPLGNVNVFKNDLGTTTDSNGMCDLHFFQFNDQITFSLIGYSTLKLKKNEVPKVLFMKKESISMNPINVIGAKKRQRKSSR